MSQLQATRHDEAQAPALQACLRKNQRLTAILLAVWLLVTFGVSFFARQLSFTFLGWPFSFWMGAQGSLIVYVLIIWFYARYMNRIERQAGVRDDEEDYPSGAGAP